MMLKRGTLLLLLSAIALTGAVLLLENRSGPRSEEAASGETEETASEKLFPFEEEEVEQFSVVRQFEATTPESADEADSPEEATEEKTTEELSFIKNDDGTWQMTQPEEAVAEGGAIAFILSQVTTPAAVPVVVDADNLEEFGLAQPESTVSLTANGSEYLLHIGGLDFLGDKRYVQAVEVPAESTNSAESQPEETLKIYAISGGIINAVNRPTEDWLLIDNSTAVDAPEDSTAAEPEPVVDEPTTESSSQPPSPEEESPAETSEETTEPATDLEAESEEGSDVEPTEQTETEVDAP